MMDHRLTMCRADWQFDSMHSPNNFFFKKKVIESSSLDPLEWLHFRLHSDGPTFQGMGQSSRRCPSADRPRDEVVGHEIPITSTTFIKANYRRHMLYFELTLKCVVVDACAMPNCIA